MELRRCSNGITNSRTHPAVGGDIAIVPTRSVHGRYLLDTEEYGEDGGVAHEGEVKVAVVCENLTHSSLWTVLAGHNFRWMGSGASSTVSSCLGCVFCDYFEPAAAAAPRNRGRR